MANLNWVDIIFLAIFLFSIFIGFIRGFIKEIVSLITLIAAFVIAVLFSNVLADSLINLSFMREVVSQSSNAAGLSTATPIFYIAIGISFALLFAVIVLVGSIISYFLSAAFASGILSFGNRIMGGLFGLVRGYILNLVVIFVVQLTPLSTEAGWQQSTIVRFYQPVVAWLGTVVSPKLENLKDKVGQTFQGMSNQIQGITDKIRY